jgi:hypothetical protein
MQAAHAALEEIDRMSHVHFTNPEVLASLRREYEQKVERDSAALDELHLERQQLHAEELQWARRHLQLVEKRAVIDAFHRGLLSQRPSRRSCSRISTRSCCVSNQQKPMGPLSKSRPQTAPTSITRWNSWV